MTKRLSVNTEHQQTWMLKEKEIPTNRARLLIDHIFHRIICGLTFWLLFVIQRCDVELLKTGIKSIWYGVGQQCFAVASNQ